MVEHNPFKVGAPRSIRGRLTIPVLMYKPYEIIEHTADVGLKANGATLKELFENAAKGMFDIIGGDTSVKNERLKVKRNIEIKKQINSFEELLVEWLSELLYIFNKKSILFNDFRISKLDSKNLVSESSGKRIDLASNTLQTEIKAVTFHDLKIEKDNSGFFSCRIIFDV